MWKRLDEQVAEVIRELLASGEWKGLLPGYRKLEQRFDVNRSTLNRALEQLTQEGRISAAEPGKRRLILNHKAQGGAPQSRRLLIIGPRPLYEYSPSQRTVLFDVQLTAEHLGWQVIHDHFDFGYKRKGCGLLEKLVQSHRPERLLFMLPRTNLLIWASENGLPFFRLGGQPFPDAEKDSGCSVSFSALACQAAERLRSFGHRRILIPIVRGQEALRENTLAESQRTWAKDIPKHELESFFPYQGEWNADAIKRFWPKAFEQLRPTAVIVKESNECLSLIGYCQRVGWRIPEDVSVIQIASDPSSLWMDPVPDRFEFPVSLYSKRVETWLKKSATEKTKYSVLTAKYMKGGTVGKNREM